METASPGLNEGVHGADPDPRSKVPDVTREKSEFFIGQSSANSRWPHAPAPEAYYGQ